MAHWPHPYIYWLAAYPIMSKKISGFRLRGSQTWYLKSLTNIMHNDVKIIQNENFLNKLKLYLQTTAD